VEWLAGRLSGVEGIVAIALGGSRAQGTYRPDSDWDFGLYYRGTVDPDAIRALGYPGTVVAPGEWAYPMNGGAWLTVEGQKVDLLYRDLDDVERVIHEAEDGRWELHRVPGYLCGCRPTRSSQTLPLATCLRGLFPSRRSPIFSAKALRAAGDGRRSSRFARRKPTPK
jgi:Nucleotidyltransferase domain